MDTSEDYQGRDMPREFLMPPLIATVVDLAVVLAFGWLAGGVLLALP